jgi:hypothetical protein
VIRSSFHGWNAMALAFPLLLGSCTEPAPTGVADGPTLGLAGTGAAPTTLVHCATSSLATSSATIGSRGGLLAVDGARLAIPPGAVRRPTRFVMTVPPSQLVAVDIRASGVEHYRFAKPVLVTMDYGKRGCADLADGRLGVWYVDRESGALLEYMGGIDLREAHAVAFTTDHLSTYAIAH